MRLRKWDQGRARRRGLAATELAVTMPLFLALLMGVWEISRMVEVKRLLSSAAREGARQASTGSLTNSQVQGMVQQFLRAALNDNDSTGARGVTAASRATITVTNLTQTGVDVSNANQLDQLQVSISINYSDVGWGTTNFYTSPSTVISATCFSLSMKDVGYPSSTELAIE